MNIDKRKLAKPESSKVALYQSADGKVAVDVRFERENFWLTQKALAELFGVQRPAITKHLRNIFSAGELAENSVCSILEHTAEDGKIYPTTYYNLDAAIAVGYRVNSVKATHFRIWATNTLREFIIKGFALNDEMLKRGREFGRDYFDELLERIREIRASERRAYQKIADVFEQCSSDYRSDTVILSDRAEPSPFCGDGKNGRENRAWPANSAKPFMGLTTWKNSPKGKILKSDVTVAKNYLNEAEVSRLNRLVVMFIDFAELRALNRQVMSMKDWVERLRRFLDFNEQQVLIHAGKISHEKAVARAHTEFEKYRVKQDQQYVSDFDAAFARYLKAGEKP